LKKKTTILFKSKSGQGRRGGEGVLAPALNCPFASFTLANALNPDLPLHSIRQTYFSGKGGIAIVCRLSVRPSVRL